MSAKIEIRFWKTGSRLLIFCKMQTESYLLNKLLFKSMYEYYMLIF